MGVVKVFGCNYVEFDFAYFIFVNNFKTFKTKTTSKHYVMKTNKCNFEI